MESKIHAYEALVEKRKKFCFSSPELTNPSQTLYDVNEIEPWAQWQNNLNAKILLIGQEYCDRDTYTRTQGKVERYYDTYEYPSNKNLCEYFKLLDFHIGHPLKPNKENPIFFTNAVMGLKPPPMSSNFKSSWLPESRKEFLKPLIDILKPKIIITIGRMSTKSVGRIFNYKFDLLKTLVENSPIRKNETLIFPVFHTGGLGLRNRSKAKQLEDWRKIRKWL